MSEEMFLLLESVGSAVGAIDELLSPNKAIVESNSRMCANALKYSCLLLQNAPIFKIPRWGQFWKMHFERTEDNLFKNNYRINRTSFENLCSHLKHLERNDATNRQCLPLEKRIAIALYALGSTSDYRSIANLFGVRKSTVRHILNEFCEEVWKVLGPLYLNCLPLMKEKIEDCVQGFERLGFPQCLGAMGGSHIRVHPAKEDAMDYFNCKGFHSVNLFSLVDSKYRLIYINVGVPGRYNDAAIYEASSLKRELENCRLLDEMCTTVAKTEVPVVIIADSSFRLSRRIMKPYPHTHTRKQRTFNTTLSSCRRLVDTTFRQIKARFRRIGKMANNDIKNTVAVIKTCCVLHNYLNIHKDNIHQSWLENLKQEPNEALDDFSVEKTDGASEAIRTAIASFLVTRAEDGCRRGEDEKDSEGDCGGDDRDEE